jgi:hypothetical protein
MSLLLLGLAASTLLSEDAACVAAGLLIRRGDIPAAAGVAACAIGIYAGDALLWCAGRLFRGFRLQAEGLQRFVDSPRAILASRFIPGTRLPLYLAAGAIGQRPGSFFFWTFVAVLLWTPLIVLGTATSIVAGACILAAMHLAKRVEWRRAWPRVVARLDRWRRWEFWPSAILYAPVALHIARLALRHGGLGTLSAANPGMPEGGFVGESKSAIVAQLPERWTLRASLIEQGGVEARLDDLRRLIELDEHAFPVVLKPDAGQRGIGVRLVHALDEAHAYFKRQPGAAVVQRYHPGPFEAGIFYYRRPGETRGRVFSITDKQFPVVTGDGHSTLEELIWAHPRYRLQASVFLQRHEAERGRVLAPGEDFRLAMAGNHAQGTLFLDGAHLLTPALERRVDEIARSVSGFYIGRFDVRYSDVEQFRRGEDLAIVELNGVTSESTNIYDPSLSLFNAWRVLCQQWTLVFEIGAANRARGHQPASAGRLLRLALQHLRETPALPIAS